MRIPRPAADQSRAAADRLQQVISSLDDAAARGRISEQKAAYLHLTGPVAAQQLLAGAARETPPSCGRPRHRPCPRPAAVQARAAAESLAGDYKDGISLVPGVRAMTEQIQWDEDRTGDARPAWQRLGRHPGFTCTRPEKLYGTGADNLRVLSAVRHAVTELKTSCTTALIAKKDLDQLGGSVRWYQDHPRVTSLPAQVHPGRDCGERDTPVPGMRW